jgi:hypothetical protein
VVGEVLRHPSDAVLTVQFAQRGVGGDGRDVACVPGRGAQRIGDALRLAPIGVST